MTKMQALNSFFSSFGIPAYEENSIYSEKVAPQMPYITYNVVTDSFGGGEVTLSCSIWYRSPSWKEIEEKADEMSVVIGYGGKTIPADGGYIWLKRGSPFAQSMEDPSDDLVKRKYISIMAEYLTAN